MATFEIQLAKETWKASGERTLERLESLIRHYCKVYGRDEAYTQTCIDEALRGIVVYGGQGDDCLLRSE